MNENLRSLCLLALALLALYFFRQMLNAALQNQKVTYAKYVAAKQQEIKHLNSFEGNQLSRTAKQKELAEKLIFKRSGENA